MSTFGGVGHTFRDEEGFGTLRVNTLKVGNAPFVGEPSALHVFHDDFTSYDATATVGKWVEAADAGGAIALDDVQYGVLSNETDGDDTDGSTVASVNQNWLFGTTKKLWFEARVKLAEANTDDAIIGVGLSTVATDEAMQDAAAGPPATYDGALWFKVDGGTVWQFETSNAGSQTTTASAGTFNDDTWVRLGFYYDPADGTTARITPYMNGTAGTAHTITISGLVAMNIVFHVKAGGANAEDLEIDYVTVVQER